MSSTFKAFLRSTTLLIACLVVLVLCGMFLANNRSTCVPEKSLPFAKIELSQPLVSPAWIYEMHPWSNLRGKYSQGSQDLYLDKIFSVLGDTNKYFVEFGVDEDNYGGNGANTRDLYEKGWRGLLLDAFRENPKINLHKHLIFANNIADLFVKYGVPKEFDYLSVDMDVHDLWVFRAILQAGIKILFLPLYRRKSLWSITHAATCNSTNGLLRIVPFDDSRIPATSRNNRIQQKLSAHRRTDVDGLHFGRQQDNSARNCRILGRMCIRNLCQGPALGSEFFRVSTSG